jgi:hypothetical protein
LKEETGGSCSSNAIYAVKDDGNRVQAFSDDSDELGIGTSDKLINYGRRYYVVTAGPHPNEPLIVKSISAQGELHPVCELTPGNTKRVVIRSTVPSMCSAAATGNLRSVTWQPVDLTVSFMSELPPELPGGFPETVEAATVDLAGDGTTQTVLRYQVLTGAGCGNGTAGLVVVSKDMKMLEKSAIAERLATINTDGSADIVLSAKHAYILGTLNIESTPALLSLEADPPKEVCNFMDSTTYVVGRVFPSEEHP